MSCFFWRVVREGRKATVVGSADDGGIYIYLCTAVINKEARDRTHVVVLRVHAGARLDDPVPLRLLGVEGLAVCWWCGMMMVMRRRRAANNS